MTSTLSPATTGATTGAATATATVAVTCAAVVGPRAVGIEP